MKECRKCGVEQPEENYAFQFKSKGKRFAVCRSCRSIEAKARWATGNLKESNYASKKKNYERLRDYIWSVIKDASCMDCGETNPIVFEFDHVRGEKFADVTIMVTKNYGLDRIKAEIEKCDIVCANCHKIRTSTRGNHWRVVRLSNK